MESEIEECVRVSIEKILEMHALRGARAFDYSSEEALNSIPKTKRPPRDIYEKIISGVVEYVAKHFDKSVVTRCYPGDLLREEHPKKILEYVIEYLNRENIKTNNKYQAT